MVNNYNQYSCGFCKEKDSTYLYLTYDIFGNNYSIHRCNKCRAYFLAPPPTPEQLAMAYDESYYGSGDEKFKEGIIEKLLDYFRTKRAEKLCSHIPKRGSVLDIGCGNGRFLGFVKSLRKDVEIYGTEMEGNSASRAAKIPSIHLKTGTLREGDFAAESMDAVTLFHVFEHLTEPQQTLDTISRIVKKNGVLVMSFPNIDSFQSHIFKGKWLHLDPPRHIFFFSPKDFKQQMNCYGFTTISEKHFSMEYNPFGMQQSLLNCLFSKREVLYESLKGNKEYIKEFSSLNLLLQNIFFKVSAPAFIALDAVDALFRKGATVEFVLRKDA